MATTQLTWTKTETGYEAQSKYADNGVFHARRDKRGKFELYDGEKMVREAHGVALKECKVQAQEIADKRTAIYAETPPEAPDTTPVVTKNSLSFEEQTGMELVSSDGTVIPSRETPEEKQAWDEMCARHGVENPEPSPNCTCPDPDTLPTYSLSGTHSHHEPCPGCVTAYNDDLRNGQDCPVPQSDSDVGDRDFILEEHHCPTKLDIEDAFGDRFASEPSEADLDHLYHAGHHPGIVPVATPNGGHRWVQKHTPEQEQRRSLTINRINWGQLMR